MPAKDPHIQQAEHNEALFDHLASASPTYLDWQVTSLFYAALHYVDAHLATVPGGGMHPKSHGVRDNQVATHTSLKPVYVRYQELQNRSVDARYDLVAFTLADVAQIRAAHFAPLRTYLRGLLGI